jgi:hypothetical protein
MRARYRSESDKVKEKSPLLHAHSMSVARHTILLESGIRTPRSPYRALEYRKGLFT